MSVSEEREEREWGGGGRKLDSSSAFQGEWTQILLRISRHCDPLKLYSVMCDGSLNWGWCEWTTGSSVLLPDEMIVKSLLENVSWSKSEKKAKESKNLPPFFPSSIWSYKAETCYHALTTNLLAKVFPIVMLLRTLSWIEKWKATKTFFESGTFHLLLLRIVSNAKKRKAEGENWGAKKATS